MQVVVADRDVEIMAKSKSYNGFYVEKKEREIIGDKSCHFLRVGSMPKKLTEDFTDSWRESLFT